MRHTFLSLCLLLSVVASAATFSTFDSRTDFRDESIYFLMTTRFFDGDPSNNTHCWDGNNPGDPEWRGDFKGLIEKMDYIKALGFTAIWITPIVENASGLDYHGYHASNFSDVDHRYYSEGVGFQQVVDAAHARGMKIILDIVLNHTGNFGEYNLCREFQRDWNADQSKINECMKVVPAADGGKLPTNYASLPAGQQYDTRLARMKNTDGKNHDTHNYWHHYGNFNWDETNRWWAQIAGDCVDLNTENEAVAAYLRKCYGKFIEMGVDGFRIDTSGHIARLSFNNNFIPQFNQMGADSKNKRGEAASEFFMFGEVCARHSGGISYRQHANLSPFYYTWKESKNYDWDYTAESWNSLELYEKNACSVHKNHLSCEQQGKDDFSEWGASSRTTNNAFLDGNKYHTPDHSQYSGFSVIDFPMHWTFGNASGAWNTASPSNDKYYNDATYNVVYVDSHDYGPDQDTRYSGSQESWAENLSLMFTYRGIPCIYYGTEVEFQKGKICDKGTLEPLKNTGRAYFGGYIKGNVTATGFGQYTADGNAAATLSQPIAQHLIRLNQIRQAIPALRKGQYSREGCSGSFAFKRRYTDSKVDSYVLVCISGGATFTGIENGKYVDAITGDVKNVTDGKLTASCSGKGNMRIYVLNGTGKIGVDTKYLNGGGAAAVTPKAWDGSQMEDWKDDTWAPGQGGGGTPVVEPEEPVEPCINDAEENAVFFTRPDDWGNYINCYVWGTGGKNAGWPGAQATYLGNKKYKYILADGLTVENIIWNDGSKQTKDLTYQNQYMYDKDGAKTAVTRICKDGEDPTVKPDPITPDPTPGPVEGPCRIYYAGSAYTTPYLWAWDENPKKNYFTEWPGVAMTKAGEQFEGKDLWFYEFTDVLPQKCIFSNNGKPQSADLTTKGCDYVWNDSEWKPLHGTASIDQTTGATMVQKVLYNGQLYILLGDHMYNAQGQFIR